MSTRASQIRSHSRSRKDDHGGLERFVDKIDLDNIMQDKACRGNISLQPRVVQVLLLADYPGSI